MLRRLPVFATLVVLAAVAVMIRLGFWQLDRMQQKEALLAHYAQALTMSADAPWPSNPADAQNLLYRHTTIDCVEVMATRTVSGRNIDGEPGMAHQAQCRLAGGGSANVVLGWSKMPQVPDWRGGRVGGFIAPGPRLVASPPQAGLGPNAVPNPSEIPNNHLAYAVQWFLFAATALVIYTLAVRKRLRG